MRWWIPRVVNADIMCDSAGTATRMHRHNYVQSGLILKGNLIIELPNSKPLTLLPGDFFSLAQYQEHLIANAPGVDVVSADLRFKCRDAGDTAMLHPRTHGVEFVGVMACESFVIRLGLRAEPARILRGMAHWVKAPPEARAFVLLQRLLQLANALSMHPRRRLARVRSVPMEHRAVRETLRIIHADYARSLTESDVAQKLGLSAGHLSRLFRQHVQMGFKQYLVRQRLEIAKQLLLHDENMPMKEVAWRAGFGDQQQFSRIFRRLEGCLPSEFRV